MPYVSTDITGIVLAGGLSTRMGRDKACLPYHGKRLVDHQVHLLQMLHLGAIYVNGCVSGYECIPDRLAHHGPLSGIDGIFEALHASAIQAFLFIPVDMPLLTSSLLQALLSQSEEAEAVYYQDHPLPLLLKNTLAVRDKIAARFLPESHSTSLKKLLSTLSVKVLEASPAESGSLINVNTPTQYLCLSTQHAHVEDSTSTSKSKSKCKRQ